MIQIHISLFPMDSINQSGDLDMLDIHISSNTHNIQNSFGSSNLTCNNLQISINMT